MITEILDILWWMCRTKFTERVLTRILKTIYIRYTTYGSIGFSRKEYGDYCISEDVLRRIIDILIKFGILEWIWKARNSNWQPCNIYTIGANFISAFEKSIGYILNRISANQNAFSRNISEKIVDWNNTTNYVDFIKENWYTYWIDIIKKWNNWLHIWEEWEKIWVGENIIKNFKTEECFSLFDYLKLKTKVNTASWISELATQLWLLGSKTLKNEFQLSF